MCLVLPARVIAVNGEEATVELHGGMQATANLTLRPNVAVGQFVMVDRGMVLEIIGAAEAAAIIAMYEEIGELLEAADEAAFGPRGFGAPEFAAGELGAGEPAPAGSGEVRRG